MRGYKTKEVKGITYLILHIDGVMTSQLHFINPV